ncbi:DNA polymerase III subunit gamma and tau [Georgenia faecalis]|uniref:DNA polymerase III subunit gamma and tau n=1 Tax=Georgenia faecalis TaxID=2483799 RepID=UPI000F09299E|nr:DNA polymerase III subunit gamma and tau [Georgenia faecalis]
MSTALYRRYRPESFADVIGQEHVTEPLMAALRADRVTHAYLFSGPRGCGKTTSARIFARCLNCAEGPTDTPCGTCDSCVELARDGSGSLDVVEMDAASHGGVEDARDLRERAVFAPARDRYKIFIIDEAHMVSNQGFNALLKLVEEPPRHVKFVFATTEPDKVIGTIRSRTHHYPFRLVPPERLQAYLEELCTAEGVRVAPGVLPLVVRAGGGSVRDSLSVLDQLIAGAQEGLLDYEHAVALLGYTHATLLDDVVDALAARDGASVFRVVDRVIDSGHDPRRFVEDLLERLRDLVVIAVAGEHAGSVLRSLPEDQLGRMRVQAQHLGAGQLSRAADLVNDALTEMTGATSPRLQLELLCARLLLPGADDGTHGYGARLDRIEHHLSRASAPAGADAGRGAPAAPPPAPVPAAAPAPAAAPTTPSAARPGAQPAPAGRQTGAPADDGGTSGGGVTPDAHASAPRTSAPRGSAGSDAAPARTHADAAAREDRSGGATGATGRASGSARPDQRTAEGPGAAPAPGTPRDAAGSSVSPQPGAPSAPRVDAAPPRPAPAPAAGPAAAPAAGTGPAAATGDVDADMVRRRWPEVLETLARLKRTTWALVSQNGQVAEISGGVLRLGFTTAGLAQAFRSGPHTEPLQRALAETLGVQVRIEPVLSASAAGGDRGAPSAEPPAPAPMPPTTWDAPAPTGWDPGPAAPAAPSPVDPALQAAGASDDPWPPDPGPAEDEPPTRGPSAPRGAASRPDGPGRSDGGTTERPASGRDASGHRAPAQGGDRRDGASARGARVVREGRGAPMPPTPEPARYAVEDDVPSMDDPDAEDSGLVGPPLIARMLGGTIIDEQRDLGAGRP